MVRIPMVVIVLYRVCFDCFLIVAMRTPMTCRIPNECSACGVGLDLASLCKETMGVGRCSHGHAGQQQASYGKIRSMPLGPSFGELRACRRLCRYCLLRLFAFCTHAHKGDEMCAILWSQLIKI